MNDYDAKAIEFIRDHGEFAYSVGDGKVPADIINLCNDIRRILLQFASLENDADAFENYFYTAAGGNLYALEKLLFSFKDKYPYSKHRFQTLSDLILLAFWYKSLFWIMAQSNEPEYRHERVYSYIVFHTNNAINGE